MNSTLSKPLHRQVAPRDRLFRTGGVLAAGIAFLTLLLSGCSSVPVSHVPATQLPTGPHKQVVNTAYTMLGTPYRYGGSNPNGFDCSGLVQFSFAQAGLKVPRTAIEQFKHSTPVSDDSLLPGDLVFFTLRSWRVAHVGIYVGDGKFIHAASAGQRVMESQLSDTYWQDHWVRAGRLP